jgi:hypothetical protein
VSGRFCDTINSNLIFVDFRVVLDARVLANSALVDVFLTFAETPRLYLPRWSEQILEVTPIIRGTACSIEKLNSGIFYPFYTGI